MLETRKDKRDGNQRRRLPGVLLVLAMMVFLLTSGGSAGAAVRSTGEDNAVPESRDDLPVKRRAAVVTAPVPEEETPVKTWGLLPASGTVEDTYFDDVVFLGDSRTEGFGLYSGLKHGTFLFGVGATVESVFSKPAWEVEGENGKSEKIPLLDALAEMDVGKVYLMFGVNELGWTKVENFHDQYVKVIDRIRVDHPDAQIVLQAILPVSALQDAKETYVNNERILVYNEVIAALAEEEGCWFANVAEAVSDKDGCLKADWNFDGIHLNPKGCRAWLHYLRAHSVDGALEV